MTDSLLTPDIHARLRSIAGVTLDADTTFADLTTLHLGGRPRLLVRCSTSAAIAEVVPLLDAHRIPLLVVAGGSNLVVADGDLDLVVVLLDNRDLSVDAASGRVVAGAGVEWDEVVASTVAAGLGGIECLSGIPGSAGATPVQNVGAYGAEITEVLVQVQLLDRASGEVSWVPTSDLELAYRYSNLKFTGRGVVLSIELQLTTDGLSAPLRYGELARRLGADSSGGTQARFPVAEVRDAVLELRRGKGMVVDPEDHDTWSAGSFFTNPVVSTDVADAVAEKVGEPMPRFAAEGGEKLSAAWLIERAGFRRGHPGEAAPVRLSTKHTLALTNRGAATTADLVKLAREVRDGVRAEFGITLVPEPVWVGVSID